MGRFVSILGIVAALLLAGCASVPDTPLTLEEAIEKDLAITLPLRVSEKGLLIVEGVQVGGKPLKFVLDTGATQSAIFQRSVERLDLNLESKEETMVHGMIDSQRRQVTTLPSLKMGTIELQQKPVVILDNRKSNLSKFEKYDGLIGMDILNDYQLLISPAKSQLKLIPNKQEIYVPSYWSRIELFPNPFQMDNRTLHFMYMRIGGRRTVALIDTGSEFSLMNWSAARFAQVKSIRRKLRQQWEMEGAVGVFRPTATIKLERFRGGQKFWIYEDFIVMDFDSLDVLGVGEEPFIIAGMSLFGDETLFIDFQRNFLAIKSGVTEDIPYWEEKYDIRYGGLH